MFRSHVALQFCYSYAELVERIQDQDADPSLLPYALYYSGSVDIITPGLTITELTDVYRRNTTDRHLVSGLTAFARMCIARNLIRYTQHLLAHVTCRLENGNECVGHRGVLSPSPATLEMAASLHKRGVIHITSALHEAENSMDTAVAAVLFDAATAKDRIPYEHLDRARINHLVELLNKWICSLEGVAGFSGGIITQHDLFKAGATILKAAVALEAMLVMDVSFEQIRAERYQYLGVIPRSIPGQPEPSTSDVTLAALPRPTPDLIRLCQSQGNMSTTGRLYVKLHQLVAQGQRDHD